MEKGRIIVIEGLDGTGKGTQTELLYKRLKDNGEKVITFSYPNYPSQSSALVKMYLDGNLGELDDINPYVSSSFYSVDRFASYLKHWKVYYDKGYTILLDRYVSSNILFQSSKIDNEEEKLEFLKWLDDFEHTKGCLPRPNEVLYLDLDESIAIELRKNRTLSEGFKTGTNRDIHEEAVEYMSKVKSNEDFIVNYCDWNRIKCSDENGIYSIEEIHELIVQQLNLK